MKTNVTRVLSGRAGIFGAVALSLLGLARPAGADPCPADGNVTSSCTLETDFHGGIRILTSGVTLDCNGKSVSGMGGGIGIDAANVSSVTIKGCIISGTFHRLINLSGVTGSWIESNTVDRAIVDPFNRAQTGRGISIEGSDGNTFHRNRATNNGSEGIVLLGGSNNVFTRSYLANNERDGIDTDRTHNTRVEGNHAIGNKRNGIEDDFSDGLIIAGNAVELNGRSKGDMDLRHGISLGTTERSQVVKNRTVGNVHQGIRLQRCREVTVTNNFLCANNTSAMQMPCWAMGGTDVMGDGNICKIEGEANVIESNEVMTPMPNLRIDDVPTTASESLCVKKLRR